MTPLAAHHKNCENGPRNSCRLNPGSTNNITMDNRTDALNQDLTSSGRATDVAEAERRRIFLWILYTLSIFLLCLLALVVYQTIHFKAGYSGIGWPIIAGLLVGCAGLLLAVRRGYVRSSALIFLTLYFLGNAYGSYRWGASMPSGLLSYSLFIAIAGAILGRRSALLAAGLSAGSILWSGLREYSHHTLPIWKTEAVTIDDLIAYTVMLGLAAFFSWLFTRSIEQSLERALRSERALTVERDNLEVTVAERTREWKEAELRRSTELGRFIEFGKLSAGLFHDLINPLTAVSLSFEAIQQESLSLPGHAKAREAIERAVRSARNMEEQMNRLRKHMKLKGESRVFDAAAELRDMCQTLQYQAREKSIILTCNIPKSFYLTGDPIRFYQACANIILNSFEAFGDQEENDARQVSISGKTEHETIRLIFKDNGPGMTEEHNTRIFEPFFTTKPHGLGLGLAMVRDIVVGNFQGTIECQSRPNAGTSFIISLPLDHSSDQS